MDVELGQIKQRVENQHFYLYHRALHPELFRISHVKHLKQRRYQAEVWIVGLSHVVTVQIGNQFVTELISEENDLLPKAGLVTSFRFRGERDHTQAFDDGVRYMMSSQVEKMTSNLFPSSHRDLMRYAKKRGTFCEFDEWEHDGLVPFTFVDCDPRERELHVHAYHAYPDDLTILKTQSIVEIAPPRNGAQY